MSYPVTAPTPPDSIRPALREDAGEIARLFLISSDGLAACIWSRMRMAGLSLEEIGAARYARTNTAFSFENCPVAVHGLRIAGMVHAFPMTPDTSGAGETDAVLRPYAEPADRGSLSVPGPAVHDRYRGRGIGGELMDRLYALARPKDLPRISLICFGRNEAAPAFYRKRVFQEIARRPVVPHPDLHYQDGDTVLLVRPFSNTRQI
jgi:ribosomal protein S18 acetylase RimI-like enzyme